MRHTLSTTPSEPYFHRDETKRLIRQQAESDDLTIIFGAGASADRGRPSWKELIEYLLLEVGRLQLLGDAKQQQAFARQVIETHDLISAASIVRQALGRDLETFLRQGIYRREKSTPGGIFSKALAYSTLVWRDTGGKVTLITINFDDSVEQAFASEELQGLMRAEGLSARAFVSASGPDEKTIPIYHLHGYLPEKGPAEGDLIFSEADYAKVTAAGIDWRSELIANRLADSTCVFVGLGMQDPNLTRYLLRSVSTPRKVGTGRYVAFAVQGEGWRSEQEDIRHAISASVRLRLDHLDLAEMQTDYYGEIAQHISELNACRLLTPDSYFSQEKENRFGLRLERWWRQMCVSRLNKEDHDRFSASQTHCNKRLAEVRDGIYSITENVRDRGPNAERFKVELWARNQADMPRRLDLWFSSESRLTASNTMLGEVIGHDSTYLSIQTFCFGAPYMRPTAHPQSRWQYFFCAPIFLTGRGWYQLPVGVITLGSTKAKSSLTALTPEKRDEIWGKLREVGEQLLTPSAGSRPGVGEVSPHDAASGPADAAP